MFLILHFQYVTELKLANINKHTFNSLDVGHGKIFLYTKYICGGAST